MGISHSEAYAAAGVDIEAGYQGVKMMNRYVQRLSLIHISEPTRRS